MLYRIVIFSLLLGLGSTVHAQTAADSAQNYPATVGSGVWNNGDNFGYGFQPWQFITSGNAGLFLGDSTENGGDGMGNGGSSGGINSPNIRAFGAFANSGGSADAIRPFQSALSPGQTFSVDFDNGFIDTGASEGIRLATLSGTNLWQFLFVGGQSTYEVIDASGTFATTLPFTADGMHISFTLGALGTYVASITEANGPSQTFSGSLGVSGSVGEFGFFNHNGGFNSSNNDYVNNLMIVPEPSTLFLAFFGAALLAIRFNRRSPA